MEAWEPERELCLELAPEPEELEEKLISYWDSCFVLALLMRSLSPLILTF